MFTKINILQANPEDHLELTHITKSSKALWGYAPDQMQLWDRELTIRPEDFDRQYFFKILDQNKILGYYSFWADRPEEVHLENLFVLPEYTGQGIGKSLLEDFIHRVQLRGYRSVTLESDPHAVGFYKRAGFREIGRKPSSIPNRFLPVMQKYVSPQNPKKPMQENYLNSVRQQFQYYQTLGERTFAQLNDEDLFWQYYPESNSIAIIVNHLWGNMMSRWTDFLTSDGEKTWRERDLEFEDVIQTREAMMAKWNEGWNCLYTALDSVNPDNFDTIIYIRNQGHSVVEAVNRQLAHYASHIGQIIYIGRMIRAGEWHSLSIPKGKSEEYNKEKFSHEKRREHFTKEFLDDQK